MLRRNKNIARSVRHRRIRMKVKGNLEIPRLNVFRSNKHIYAQIIDDDKGDTLISVSTCSSAFKKQMENGSNIEASKVVGQLIAQKALEKNIKKVVFDRGGYLYHGRVKALADSARESGLVF